MDYGDMLPLERIQWDAEKGYYANRLRRLQYLKDVTPIRVLDHLKDVHQPVKPDGKKLSKVCGKCYLAWPPHYLVHEEQLCPERNAPSDFPRRDGVTGTLHQIKAQLAEEKMRLGNIRNAAFSHHSLSKYTPALTLRQRVVYQRFIDVV
ncbi:hypothetical protein JCM3766R1_004525 [Sporobolomyces carnicolor]